MRRWLAVPQQSSFADFALLVIRLVAGVAFMMHGWGKIQDPFGWMGPDSFAAPPLQALAALSEFGGGLAWVLGLLTPLGSFGIACTMSVAVWMLAIQSGEPLVSMTGGPAWELAALYFALALLLGALGPGRFSLDRLIAGRR